MRLWVGAGRCERFGLVHALLRKIHTRSLPHTHTHTHARARAHTHKQSPRGYSPHGYSQIALTLCDESQESQGVEATQAGSQAATQAGYSPHGYSQIALTMCHASERVEAAVTQAATQAAAQAAALAATQLDFDDQSIHEANTPDTGPETERGACDPAHPAQQVSRG